MNASLENLPIPKAVLFDWDNTLADTWEIIYNALRQTFIEMGHDPWSFDEVKAGREGIHHSLRSSFPRIFGDDQWERARDIYMRSFLDIHLDHVKKLPHADEVLHYLSSTNLYTAIVSNKTGKHLRTEVNHLGWDDHFHHVVGANDAKADKPNPDPVHMALERSDIEAGPHVWFIGDSETDVECAKNAGLTAIVYNQPEIAEKHGVAHVEGHQALKELLEKYTHENS